MPKGGPGKPKSPEHRAKIAEANRKKAKDPAFRKKLSDSSIGKIFTEEHKENISKSKKGKKRSLESRIKQSVTNTGRKGTPCSEEHKEHLRNIRCGRKASEKTKKIQSEIQKTLWQNPNHRKKMIESLNDYTMSEVTKANIGEANRRKAKDPIICKKISDATKGKKRSEETKQKFRGCGNPSWKGGTTSLYQLIRSSEKYSMWRFEVFKRDGFCDWFSGLQGYKNLNVHHIIPFSHILRDNQIKTFEQAIECEALWDINNGITMFESSHAAYHSMWGNDTSPIR